MIIIIIIIIIVIVSSGTAARAHSDARLPADPAKP